MAETVCGFSHCQYIRHEFDLRGDFHEKNDFKNYACSDNGVACVFIDPFFIARGNRDGFQNGEQICNIGGGKQKNVSICGTDINGQR